MKFAVAALALATGALAATNLTDNVSYEVETVTNLHTTEVTITSCSDNACATTVQSVVQSVVTETVNGVLTIYTTVCPLTESTSETTTPEAAPTSVAAESVVPASSESDIYVDITTTPVVVVSSAAELTVYAQSTSTSIYNNATVSSFEGGANNIFVAGAAGVVGVAALLL